MKPTTRAGFLFLGRTLRTYLPPSIFLAAAYILMLRLLQSGTNILLYGGGTQSEWIGYTDPLVGPVTRGYIVSSFGVQVPVELIFSILLFILGYKMYAVGMWHSVGDT